MVHRLILLLVCLLTLSTKAGYAHTCDRVGEPSYDPMMHMHMFSLPIMIGFDGMVMYGIAYDQHHMGGMDHGSMGHDGMDHHMHDGSSIPHSGVQQGIAWHLMPMFSFGGDRLKKVVNLGYQVCDGSHCEDAYKIAYSSHIDMGAGMMLMGLLPTHWFIHAGLMPMVGGDYYIEKLALSHKNTKRNPELKIPTSLEELDNWSIGDTLSYSTRGGVMCSAGVGFTIFCQASIMYMYQNMKSIRYEKISDKLLKVDITRIHKNAEGFLAGTPVTFAMAHAMQNRNTINSLSFDFTKLPAIEKFNQFLAGKLDLKSAQSLATGVMSLKETKAKSRGSMANAIAGFPFLYQVEKDTMKSHTKSKMQELLPELEVNGNALTSISAASTNTRGVFSNHKRDHTMFLSMLTPTLAPQRAYLGAFKWFYENDHYNSANIKNKLNKVGDQYGLIIPQLDQLNFHDKGYIRAEVDISFSAKVMQTILLTIQANSPTSMKDNITLDIEQFFITDANPKRVCSHNLNCKSKTIAQAKTSIDDIYLLVEKIDSYKRKGSNSKFSKFLTELGKIICKNRFLLHYLAHRGHNLSPTLSLQGEYFSPYKTDLSFERL